jgi:hypothetical protein
MENDVNNNSSIVKI